MHFSTYYSNIQLVLICLSVLMGCFSIFFYRANKINYSVLSLFAAALFSRFLAASLDPFIHMWDEQFHALVAKNLSENMLKPIFTKDIYFPYDYKNWAGNYIWVHKQPWFLWQMALSINIFGNTEFAIRFPSAIMSSLMVLLIFRIGSLVCNRKIGWYAAFLFAFSFFQIEIVTGNVSTDHNDIAFMFYVTCSVWAFFEYINSDKLVRWVLLIGLFAGIAVLNKWLTGLVIYAVWFVYLIAIEKTSLRLLKWKDFALSVLIALLVFLPWQFFIFHAYPLEAAYEFEYNSKHFSEVVEGHGGNSWFYIDGLAVLFGKIAPFIMLPGFIFLAGNSSRKQLFPYFLLIIILYVFFTIAQTKMPLFVLPAASLIFIALGAFLKEFLEKSAGLFPKKMQSLIWMATIILVGAICFDTDELERKHSVRFDEIQFNRHKAGVIACKSAALLMKNKKYAVFNVDPWQRAEFMFYTGQTGFSYFPSVEQYNTLKENKVNIAIFYHLGIPDFIKKDKSVLFLPKNFWWIYE